MNDTDMNKTDMNDTHLSKPVANDGNLLAIGRRVGQAMQEQDWLTVLGAVAPDVVAHVPAVGDLEGIDALATFLADTAEKTADGEHFELLDVLAGHSYAALYFRITARRPGHPDLDNLTLHLARIEDDLVKEIWFHNFDGPAVAAFWA